MLLISVQGGALAAFRTSSWCQLALVEFDQCLRQEFSRGVGICFDNKAYAQLSP